MPESIPRPPFDAEFEPILEVAAQQFPSSLTLEDIPTMRQGTPFDLTADDLRRAGLACEDVTIAGYEGADIVASVLARADRASAGRPGIFHTHGGGMVAGNRFAGMNHMLSWVLDHDAVAVTVEYRLPPEFPDPYPVEDCYAALEWTDEHAVDLGIAPDALIIVGMSAGGGLAAGTALLARDRGGPPLAGQILICPMLDDRDRTVSTLQFDGVPLWDRGSNAMGWTALLGDRRGTDDVSIYAAPARATDLSGLPAAFIDCGSAEVFRDEDVAYATALWSAGVQAELHVWPGGFHGFDLVAPGSSLAQAAIATRSAWVARAFGRAFASTDP